MSKCRPELKQNRIGEAENIFVAPANAKPLLAVVFQITLVFGDEAFF